MQKNNERLEEKMKMITQKIVQEKSSERPMKKDKEEKKSNNTAMEK